MRKLLRVLVGLLGFVAFLGVVVFGLLYAYGVYGAPLLETQIQEFEENAEQELENEFPGSTVSVDVLEVYYTFEGSTFFVAFGIHAVAEVSGVEVKNETFYVSAELLSVIVGEAESTIYEVSEWDEVKDSYNAAPEIIFDGASAKKIALTGIIIFAVVFVTGIVVRNTVLRKKRI